jgi:hypothetical protein
VTDVNQIAIVGVHAREARELDPATTGHRIGWDIRSRVTRHSHRKEQHDK